MTISVKHKFLSGKVDSADPSMIRPSNWNDEHEFIMATARLLGRAGAGVGNVQEISLSGEFEFSGTELRLDPPYSNKADKNTLVKDQPTLNVNSFTGATYVAVYNAGENEDGKVPLSDLAEAGKLVKEDYTLHTTGGIEGGGDLSTNRTLKLIMKTGANPNASTLTATTESDTSGDGHTHKVNASSIAAAGNAALSYGGIGAFALLRQLSGTARNPGETIAGSSLAWSAASGSGSGSGGPSGTWQCQGKIVGDASANGTTNVTMWLRIN